MTFRTETRSYSYVPPAPPPAELAALPGMALFEAMLAGRVAPPPITATLAFRLVHAEPGRVVFEGEPGDWTYNPLGSVHGGYIATLLDSAVGCAVHTSLPAGFTYTTLELKLNFTRALRADAGSVCAEGSLIHSGRRVSTAEGRLVGHDGKLYAHATTTCLIMPIGG